MIFQTIFRILPFLIFPTHFPPGLACHHSLPHLTCTRGLCLHAQLYLPHSASFCSHPHTPQTSWHASYIECSLRKTSSPIPGRIPIFPWVVCGNSRVEGSICKEAVGSSLCCSGFRHQPSGVQMSGKT